MIIEHWIDGKNLVLSMQSLYCAKSFCFELRIGKNHSKYLNSKKLFSASFFIRKNSSLENLSICIWVKSKILYNLFKEYSKFFVFIYADRGLEIYLDNFSYQLHILHMGRFNKRGIIFSYDMQSLMCLQ